MKALLKAKYLGWIPSRTFLATASRVSLVALGLGTVSLQVLASGNHDRRHCKPLASSIEQYERSQGTGQPTPACESVPQTHSHNDYEHEHPLFDAMSWGFSSVEADIWLYPNDNGNLRVAHDEVRDPTTLPTIQELYLDPLAEQYEDWHNGGVYRDGSRVTLLVDIKSTALETYQRFDEVLAEYNKQHPGLFTMYTKNPAGVFTVNKGAVTAIISGNRDLGYMESQNVRYAGYDGRQSDIGGNASPGLIPLISDNWDTYFRTYGWDGRGPMPSDIRTKMHQIIGQIHGEGKIARFWNLPNDGPNVWGPLYEEKIDLINTDDLPGLSPSTFSSERIHFPVTVKGKTVTTTRMVGRS